MRHGRLDWYRDAIVVTSSPARRTETWRERSRGLLFAAPLALDEALWIVPCNSIHTALMGYAIDVVYLTRDGFVCAQRPAVRPWRLSGCWRAFSVVELAAGGIGRLGLRIGDRCHWSEQ